MLILPTMPDIAPLLTESDESLNDYRNKALNLLCLSVLSGLPQVSIPLASRLGAPLGLSLMGPAGSDLSLVALAAPDRRERISATGPSRARCRSYRQSEGSADEPERGETMTHPAVHPETPHVAVASACVLGEGPVWDHRIEHAVLGRHQEPGIWRYRPEPRSISASMRPSGSASSP